MGIKPRRKRPPSLPAEAQWDEEEECWGAGARDASGNKRGSWAYYWPQSGAPAGTTSHDQDGLRHGLSHWLHPNGELWQSGTYVHGTKHGRFSYQRCSVPSPGDAQHPLGLSEEVVRMDMPHLDGTPQSYHMTLYNQSGAAAPLERDDSGTAKLGKGLDKLIGDTTLLMTDDSALSVDGVRVPRPVVDTRIVIKEVGARGRDVLFRPAYGDAEVYVFSPEELSRAFTLSSDYFLTDREARAAEDKAAADKLAARYELLRTIPISNTQMSSYDFLRGMYGDGYFPDFLVDKIKEILVRLCKEIEAERPQDEASLLRLTHVATEQINGLEDEFLDSESELETGAREAMAADFDAIVRSYGFTDVDIEDVIAPREW